MSTVATPPESVVPSQDGDLSARSTTPLSERDRSITPLGAYTSDEGYYPEVIELSDDDDDFIEYLEDRKPSPTPTRASSVEFLDVIYKEDTPFGPMVENEPAVERKPRAPRGPTTRLTVEQEAKIVALREVGWTMPQIAEHINRSRNTINSFIRRRNARINELISTVPGSQPPARRAVRRQPVQNQQRYEARQDVKPEVVLEGVVGGNRRAREGGERYRLKNEDEYDVKPRVAKQET